MSLPSLQACRIGFKHTVRGFHADLMIIKSKPEGTRSVERQIGPSKYNDIHKNLVKFGNF